MIRVVIESPYAGKGETPEERMMETEVNLAYARQAMAHSLTMNEAPIGSHLIYTQPGILQDSIPEERKKGIEAGFKWLRVADKQIFYMDRGWSNGMKEAYSFGFTFGIFQEARWLYSEKGSLPDGVRMPTKFYFK